MVRREDHGLLARVEAEHFKPVCPILINMGGGFFALFGGFGGVALRVFVFEYLYYGAPASPAIWRVIRVPEIVGGRQGCAVQSFVAFAHAVVGCRAVLEVVAVAIGSLVSPPGCHLRALSREVVLGLQVVFVVAFMHLELSINKELIKCF